MSVAMAVPTLSERALEVFRRAGNPFRNYFARNPDDEVCARYHVAELFAPQRRQLLGVVELYRYDPSTHSEIIPVLGNKGAGKTHLLHSIKHGEESGWQLLVTPGVYQKDSDFLEYLLFQVIDTLLGGGRQKGRRPLDLVGEELTRRLLHKALGATTREEQMGLFPAPGLVRWVQRLGLGSSQAQERTQWLIDSLGRAGLPLRRVCADSGLEAQRACDVVCRYVERTAAHNAGGLMRRHLQAGFARAALLGDESDLATFLTYGFAELDIKVRPTRQDLVLALFKSLMEVFLELKIPVVVAFDQLEDLLLARRSDDGHRVAEAFFAGVVQTMHQIAGICFLVFAERGLWNRFVPSLDGYIQDRLNNPVHVPGHGTVKTLRLEAPPVELVRRVVEARLRPCAAELAGEHPPLYPFTEEQVDRIARTEPTLRDMLQQLRHLFDHLVFGPQAEEDRGSRIEDRGSRIEDRGSRIEDGTAPAAENRLPPVEQPASIKSVIVVESPTSPTETSAPASVDPRSSILDPRSSILHPPSSLPELWEQELRAARRKLEPDGSLTGATRELQAGLGSFLQTCFEHGVKVGPWRLQHVVGELAFGEHPTYGVITIGHWVCKDGQPWKVGIGLFLGRGPGKPRDLETKLGSLDMTPPVIDHLILLRPEDDLSLTGKSKGVWQESEKRGRHARLEAVSLDAFAAIYAFPRFVAALGETLPAGQPLPNLADLLQECCEKLLEQVCMPVQGG